MTIENTFVQSFARETLLPLYTVYKQCGRDAEVMLSILMEYFDSDLNAKNFAKTNKRLAKMKIENQKMKKRLSSLRRKK